MANTGNATGPKTPPPDDIPLFSSEIKSTPNSVGTAVVRESFNTLGTNVDDVRPWIKRDIQDYKRGLIDNMLKELLYRCKSESGSDSASESESKEKEKEEEEKEKERLLQAAFKAGLALCEDEAMREAMEKHLTDFINAPTEVPSYEPFVRFVNHALTQLREVNINGIITSKAAEDSEYIEGGIIFHHNDYPIKQKHQGVDTIRKPDVVVVSYESARSAMKDGKKAKRTQLYSDIACKKPGNNFTWPVVLSTFEFKRTPKKNKGGNEKLKYDTVEVVKPPTAEYMDFGKGRSNAVQPTGSTPVPVAASLQVQGLATRSSQKRGSETLGSNEGTTNSKRVKSNNEDPNDEKPKRTDPIAQNGMYAAEMFAAHPMRQHVISCVVEDETIYIWYFDRQNAIQCSGFNFVRDPVRFLVLLLAMQRLPYAQWGHNLTFEVEPEEKIEVEDEVLGTVDLKFNFSCPDRTTHYGLRGRATNVFPVESTQLSRLARNLSSRNNTDELVAKIYWPEESRQSEAEILEEVHSIADGQPKVMDHVPDVIWSHTFKGTSTAKIRKALGIDDVPGASRALYIIVFRKLLPITQLTEDNFLRAWWHAVECHRILWEKGVRHRDISPSNLMFYYFRDSSGRDVVVGVLND
ncbi:hypothetical protein K503DRAFT_777572, partial [Rhizopogon vinicolor AM-OR11-026]